MSKNKFKVQVEVSKGLYSANIGSKTYVFVKKIDETTFEALHKPMSCKDYTHETIASLVHKKSLYSTLFDPSKFLEFNESKLQIVIFFSFKDLEFGKENLFTVKKYLSAIEKDCGIKQTLITEVDIDVNEKFEDQEYFKAFLLTFDKAYIESPVLFHGFFAFLRTLYNVKGKFTKDNIKELSSYHYGYDSSIVNFALKHDLFKLLLKNHTKIVKDLKLTDIYPKDVTNNSSDKSKHSFVLKVFEL